MSGSLQRQP